MKSASEIKGILAQCIGTNQYWKGNFHWFKYTDGVKLMWENCKAYWLLDLISSYKRKEPFQIWTLKVNPKNSTAVVTMKEDTNTPILVKQEIKYTDFPLDKMELWLIDGVLILPSEY